MLPGLLRASGAVMVEGYTRRRRCPMAAIRWRVTCWLMMMEACIVAAIPLGARRSSAVVDALQVPEQLPIPGAVRVRADSVVAAAAWATETAGDGGISRLYASEADETDVRILNEESCSSAKFISQQFCTASNPTPPSRFDKETCEWKNASLEAETQWFCQSPVATGPCNLPVGLINLQTCKTQAGWTAYRVGPFVTHGGNDWNGLQIGFNPSYIPSCRRSDLHALSDYIIGNVGVSTEPIGYPPIHQHHFHLAGSGDAQQVTLNAHGDTQCHEALGGVSCLAKRAPPGHAYFLRDEVLVNTEFNDVRPGGSEALESWIFAAWRMANCEADTPIRQIRMMPLIYPLIDGSRGTYLVPTHHETVSWFNGSFTVPPAKWTLIAGNSTYGDPRPTLLDGWIHSHGAMIHDIWFMQGRPEEVFADMTLAEPSHNQLLTGSDLIAATMDNIAARAALPNAARVACRYRSLPDEVVDGRHYHRKSRCVDLDPAVSEWVQVVFHKNTDPMPDRTPIGDSYRIHATTLFYYSGPPGEVMLQPPITPEQRAADASNHSSDGRSTDEETSQMMHEWALSYNCTVQHDCTMVDFFQAAGPSIFNGIYGDIFQLWPEQAERSV